MPKTTTTPTFAANQVELAGLLNVDRKTVARWLQIPGNPGRRADGKYPVNAWMTWATGQSRKAIGPGAAQLKERLLAAQIRRIEHSVDISMRLHVPTAEVEEMGAKLGANIRKIVTILHLKAPSLAMRSADYIEEELIRVEDDILDQLHGLAEDLDRMKEATVEPSPEPGDLDADTLPPG